jgi:hypothetical protein
VVAGLVLLLPGLCTLSAGQGVSNPSGGIVLAVAIALIGVAFFLAFMGRGD